VVDQVTQPDRSRPVREFRQPAENEVVDVGCPIHDHAGEQYSHDLFRDRGAVEGGVTINSFITASPAVDELHLVTDDYPHGDPIGLEVSQGGAKKGEHLVVRHLRIMPMQLTIVSDHPAGRAASGWATGRRYRGNACQNDGPGLMSWPFSAAEAALISQPFRNVTAASTGTNVGAVYGALRSWVPHAENGELPRHCMLQSIPKRSGGAAGRLLRAPSSARVIDGQGVDTLAL
jgi:hypothetical protein